MGPTWVLSVPVGRHVGRMNLANRVLSLEIHRNDIQYILNGLAKHKNASSASVETLGTEHVLMK